MSSNKRTSKVKNGILIAVIIAFLIAIIGGTYARFVSRGTARSSTDIAKWHILLGGTEDISSESKLLTVHVQDVVANENVVEGKLAPGKTVVATFNVDPTGSEVAVDYLMNVDLSNVSEFNNSELEISNLKYIIEGTDIEQDMLVDSETGKYLFEEQLVDVLDGKDVTFKIYITWTQSTDLARSLADTQKAVNIENILIPVNIVARQHTKTTIAARTYTRGEEIEFKGEKFFVVEDQGNSVLLLAKYCLNKQGTAQTNRNTTTGENGYGRSFSSSKYWNGKTQEATSYDLQTSESLALIPDTDTAENNAIIAAKEYGALKGVIGRLMTKAEAEEMIATNSDIMFGKWKDGTQPTQGYLFWWIGATNSFSDNYVSFVRGNVDTIGCDGYYQPDCGVRPLLIVPEE